MGAAPFWAFLSSAVIIAAMPANHFSPHGSEHRPCWHCTSFVAMIYEGSAAGCSLGKRGLRQGAG